MLFSLNLLEPAGSSGTNEMKAPLSLTHLLRSSSANSEGTEFAQTGFA